MSSLKAFLNPIKAENREVVVSERFAEDGKAVPFVIRPILQSENDTLIRKHTKKDKKGNEIFDRVAYSQELVAMAVIEPDLENADLQKAYGVLGATKTLTTMLYLGEFATLSEEVRELSGLDEDINEEIETVKN
ncbi:MAG: phage portal protein [Hungatella sp.]